MKSIEIRKSGTFGEPRKIKWSMFHHLFIVMGKQTIYTYDSISESQKVVYSSDSHEFVDIDISTEGYPILAMKNLVSGQCQAKLLAPNFFSIAGSLSTEDRQIRKVGFISGRIPLITSDSNYSDTYFTILQPYGKTKTWTPEMYSKDGLGTKGSVVSVIKDKDIDLSFIITNGGEMWTISGGTTGIESYILSLAGDNLGDGIVTAEGGLKSFSESVSSQEKVRVFVGSREWGNDMWDSGEVSSSSLTMPYGGGDNLKPGYRYWVHIMTYHSDSGWSKPQIKSFLMPKE
jgi:hypothetical protein